MPKGYIKLHRNIADHWLCDDKPFDMFHAWVDLLMMANWKNNQRIFNGQIITQERGQVVCSINGLADRWGWSPNKVRRYIAALERDNMVTKKAHTRGTTLTIEKYAFFQDSRQTDDTTRESTDESTGESTGGTQQKNSKEGKEKKEQPKGCYRTTTTMQVPTRDEVRAYCMERGSSVDADKFVDYYTSNGWMVGKNKMKDWKAAVRVWERKEAKKKKPRNEVLEMMKGGLFNE